MNRDVIGEVTDEGQNRLVTSHIIAMTAYSLNKTLNKKHQNNLKDAIMTI